MLSLSIIRGVPSFNSENVVTAKTTGAVLINDASGARCNQWCAAASRGSYCQKLLVMHRLVHTYHLFLSLNRHVRLSVCLSVCVSVCLRHWVQFFSRPLIGPQIT